MWLRFVPFLFYFNKIKFQRIAFNLTDYAGAQHVYNLN